MNNQDLLDNTDRSTREEAKFKNRTPSNLMMLVGLMNLLIGAYFLYLFFRTLALVFREDETGLVLNYELFKAMIRYHHFSFLIGFALLIGGIGLMKHTIRGWKYALGTAFFGIAAPLLKLMLIQFTPGWTVSISGAFSYFILTFFLLSLVFLLSRTIRDFFQPKTSDYFIAIIIAAILSVDYLLLVFL